MKIGTAGTFENREEAENWLQLVRAAFPGNDVYYIPLSCSIACHVGMNAAGIGVSVIAERG